MYEPLVSIIIPVYNGSDYMREAIDSALSQTYKNIEVIVVNDGSTDGGATDEIARAYGDRIRYFSKINGGVSSALNLGISQMSGEYFSWLSHDDVYETNKIEKQIFVLNQINDFANTIVCCSYVHIDENSQFMSLKARTSPFRTLKKYNSSEVLSTLLTKTTFNGCCLLIPKRVFDECGLFYENLRFCQDAVMWYKIFMKNYYLVYTEDVLVKNRVHAKQLTQTGQALFRKECEYISSFLAEDFAKISRKEENFLKMYLLSDARYFTLKKVNEVIDIGKKQNLISMITALRSYAVYVYGRIRPIIRKIYYAIFKGIKTT